MLGLIVDYLTYPGVIVHLKSTEIASRIAGIPVRTEKSQVKTHPSYWARFESGGGSILRRTAVAFSPFIINSIVAVLLHLTAFASTVVLPGVVARIVFWTLLPVGLMVGFHAFPLGPLLDTVNPKDSEKIDTQHDEQKEELQRLFDSDSTSSNQGGSTGNPEEPSSDGAQTTPPRGEYPMHAELVSDLCVMFGYLLLFYRNLFLVNFLYTGALLISSVYLVGHVS